MEPLVLGKKQPEPVELGIKSLSRLKLVTNIGAYELQGRAS